MCREGEGGVSEYETLAEPIREVVLHLFEECLATYSETATPPDPRHCSWCRMRSTVLAEIAMRDRLREELMRVGLLAVSDRQDGCISKATALRIRELAHRACWPEDPPAGAERAA